VSGFVQQSPRAGQMNRDPHSQPIWSQVPPLLQDAKH